jgi:hypothetical protein
MKTVLLMLLLSVCGILLAEPAKLYTFPGEKFGKGPGLTVKGNTIKFAPVSRMYINKKFDPAGGCFEFTAKFRPEQSKEKRLHYLWSVKGSKRTVASGVISADNGMYSLSFYVFDTNRKPVSCACPIKFPAGKSIKMAFIWDTQSISIKINGILFAKKNFKAKLQSGESFMIGTATKDRALIPMTVEQVNLFAKQ